MSILSETNGRSVSHSVSENEHLIVSDIEQFLANPSNGLLVQCVPSTVFKRQVEITCTDTHLGVRGTIDSLIRLGSSVVELQGIWQHRLSPTQKASTDVDCLGNGVVALDVAGSKPAPTSNEKARNRPEPSRTQVIPIRDHTAHCPRAYHR